MATSFHPALKDSYGRRMRKLRVSLLDACNFRCFYCMPLKPKFMPADRYLPVAQLVEICRHLVDLGIEEIRVTGGEPTLRREFRDIIRHLGELPLRKFGLTTNGLLLRDHLDFLHEVGCQHLNVSLDSLQPDNFARITRNQSWDRVVEAIRQARDRGFKVKLNAVIARGRNDHELLDFVRFSAQEGVEVRFLELMKIGEVVTSQKDLFVSAAEMIARIQEQEKLQSQTVAADSTSFVFATSNGARVGFIASESQPFCGACSRLRLSPEGYLRACLMSEKGRDLKSVPPERLPEVLRQVLALKPLDRLPEVQQGMYQIGG